MRKLTILFKLIIWKFYNMTYMNKYDITLYIYNFKMIESHKEQYD